MVKVSVIMSVYNGERYLSQAIKSILEQTLVDFELIIINDGSEDSSKEVVDSFADQRIIYFENRDNIGLANSLNKGIKIARGKYIARMDADDISSKNRLEMQYKFMEKNKQIGLIGAWAELIDKRNNIIAKMKNPTNNYVIKFALFAANPIYHSTLFIRRELLLSIGGYENKAKFSQDYNLYARLAMTEKIGNIPEYLLKLRKHKKSISQTNYNKQVFLYLKEFLYNHVSAYIRIKQKDYERYFDCIFGRSRSMINRMYFCLYYFKILKNFLKIEMPGKKDRKLVKKFYRYNRNRILNNER